VAAQVSQIDGSECLDTLAALADKSLLRLDSLVAGEPRFVMLETIREYALEQLSLNGELEVKQRRHAEHYLRLAEEAAKEYFGPRLVAALDLFEREHDNLRAALRWAIDSKDAEIAVGLGAALGEFWWIRGYIGEGLASLEDTLALQPRTASLARAKALNGAGVLASLRLDLDRGNL
jgi:predicted ATPase